MPRLLLVDDNPSIHKIVETLLAQTAIALVCVESAAEALDLIERGERFDVALLDINMGGMNGWELLEHLRRNPATAGIPIALMAGVLDTVDPQRLSQAPIQGFIKKPVELRDLGERVLKLLESPVLPPPPLEPPVLEEVAQGQTGEEALNLDSPFATVPGMDIQNLPERRGAPESLPEEDVLVLTAEDLLPEPQASPLDDTLELEELDLDSLRDLDGSEPAELLFPEEAQDLTPAEGSEASPGYDEAPTRPELPELISENPLGEELEAFPITAQDLPDLGPSLEPAPEWEAPASAYPEAPTLILDETVPAVESPVLPESTAPLPSADGEGLGQPEGMVTVPVLPEETLPSGLGVPLESAPRLDEASVDLTLAEPLLVGETAGDEEEPEIALSLEEPAALLEPEPLPTETLAAALLLNEPPSQPPAAAVVPGPPSTDLVRLVEALKADPELLDALAKAVVARLGNDALREIAWEIMPELAERQQRP